MATHRAVMVGFTASAACLLAGCGSGGDLISTVALPSQQTAAFAAGVDLPVSPGADRQSSSPDLTPAQRDYLMALDSVGIHSSNDLRALSIGAYVCQARAAGQSDQTVWDSIAPMVRSDVIEASAGAQRSLSPQTAAVANVDALVGDVIQIATRELC